MPCRRDPKGEKRPAEVIGDAVPIIRTTRGERDGGEDKPRGRAGRNGGKLCAERISAELAHWL
jgi:hypothetical protein